MPEIKKMPEKQNERTQGEALLLSILSEINENSSENHDDLLFEKLNLLPTRSLSIIESAYFSLTIDDLRKKIGTKNVKTLLSCMSLKKEEREKLRTHPLEKISEILSIAHLVFTTLLGLSSGILGVLTLANPLLVAILIGIFAFCLLPALGLIKSSWHDLRQAEKNNFKTVKLAKIRLLSLKLVQKNLQKQLINKTEKIKNWVKHALLDEESAKKPEILESADLFIKSHDICNLKIYLNPILGSFITGSEKVLNNLFDGLKDELDIIEERGEGLAYNLSDEHNEEDFSSRTILLTPNDNPLTTKKWWKQEGNTITRFAFTTFLSMTAGTFVFPSLIFLLADTKLDTIHTLGINKIAQFASTNKGLLITMGFVVLIGITLTLAALHKKYRDSFRLDYIKEITKEIIEKQTINERLNLYFKCHSDLYEKLLELSQFALSKFLPFQSRSPTSLEDLPIARKDEGAKEPRPLLQN